VSPTVLLIYTYAMAGVMAVAFVVAVVGMPRGRVDEVVGAPEPNAAGSSQAHAFDLKVLYAAKGRTLRQRLTLYAQSRFPR
jgi:hypothetical protein